MNFSLKSLAAAAVIIAGSTTFFPPHAGAASGTINIQTVPEGAKYLIVESRSLRIAAGGFSPYFDMGFPTGKYFVCFQLDGYLTVWQESAVSTYGSSWVGPVMKRSDDVPQATCEEVVSRAKEKRGATRTAVLQQLSAMGPLSSPTGESVDVPASASGGQEAVHHQTDEQLDHQSTDGRERKRDDAAAALRQKGMTNPRSGNLKK